MSEKVELAIILGTRPEIIKFCPIIRKCQELKISHNLIHTNQHYSYGLDKKFFEELELPSPDFNLNIGSGTHGKQTSKMLEGIETILLDVMPKHVLVQGDTNSTLAGSLAASKINGINLGHVEAGLRSFDRTMPEEINRIISDHISDKLYPPLDSSVDNLINEGIPSNKILKVGNTIVESILQNKKISDKSKILKQNQIDKKNYFLVTFHRQENVDLYDNLSKFVDIIGNLSSNRKVVFSLHPRTKKNLNEFNLLKTINDNSNIIILEDTGYLDFLSLLSNCEIVLTDSGGIQEESCILGTPCITLRNSTERPETIDIGSNFLTHLDSNLILESIDFFRNNSLDWKNPYGDGNASQLILNSLFD